ncbi:hypothetical protein [Dinoroseobacter sp. S375]|uniref:hypothetical protein n=1 Tax=Dinoroseobacter sp. S375 TaxID=3415136 RepID=UPI003C7C821B
MLKSLTVGFCMAGMVTSLQAQEFNSWQVPRPLELTENVNAGTGTMSGNARLAIRTNTLFSAFQLIRNEDEDHKIEMKTLDFAPILLPAAITKDAGVKLCAEVRTINGFYEAIGTSVSLSELQDGDTAKTEVITKISSQHIDNQYSEALMLMRGFLAPDCTSRRSSYYVPMFFSDEADTLLAVFEIGNAQIDATLYGVRETGEVSEDYLKRFECVETERVDRGYDCRLNIDTVRSNEFMLYEVRLEVVQPHRPEARIFRSRITLPPPVSDAN